MEKVLIDVLAGNNFVNTSIAELANHVPYLNEEPTIPFRFAFHVESGVRGQELARNRICKRFLDSKADILLMVDNDMVLYQWRTLSMLQTPDWDIVAPLQLMFDGGIDEKTGELSPHAKPCAFMYDKEAGGHRNVYPAPGVDVQEVDAVGGGVIAIQRHVLEDERMVLAPRLDPPAYFRTCVEANYVRKRGNDIDFCFRARECGYKVKINWSCPSGHLKTNDLYLVEMYAKQQFALGYETGGRHALSVDQGEDRQAGGAPGGVGAGGDCDAEVARVRVDRVGGGG